MINISGALEFSDPLVQFTMAAGIQSGAIEVAFLPMPKRPNTMLNDASNVAITLILCSGERPSSHMLARA
jgi:hypothetical protein